MAPCLRLFKVFFKEGRLVPRLVRFVLECTARCNMVLLDSPFIYFDDPFPWLFAGFVVFGSAIIFLIFLWLLRVRRLIFVKNIVCPERKRHAMVELVAQVGELGSYRDIRTCSLEEGEKGVTCQKCCLTFPAVIDAPYISVKKPVEDYG